MPNWCENKAIFSHDDSNKIDELIERFNTNSVLQYLAPMPDGLVESNVILKYLSDVKASESEIRTKLKEEYGYPSWYDWRIKHWGTKWDFGTLEGSMVRLDENTVTFRFLSAWSPPIEAYRTAEENGFSITAYYHESGVGFCGVFYKGVEHTYNIPEDKTAIDVVIPAAVNEAFRLTEQYLY